uniref:Glycylpeptide N-tetradecanoyltransferase n=1 Tax=Pavo cristatus TaxID=9049 RepID=A0A8C9FGI4_PAVCR
MRRIQSKPIQLSLMGIWERRRRKRNRREKRRKPCLVSVCVCFLLQLFNLCVAFCKRELLNLLNECNGKINGEAGSVTVLFFSSSPPLLFPPSKDEVITSHGAIEPDKDNVRLEPYSLPQGFMWDTLDLSNAEVLKELYTLLNENYVEDDDNMFRFDYSPEFLLWALRPPGWLPQWHCGVRVSSNKKLVGFISAIPANIRIYDSVKKMVEINFLCVHKKLRSKRVAPVLIREITRRVNLEGIFQAVYTAGVVLPKPVATCRYWHRSLNPRKLVEVKFSHLSRNMTLQRTMKLYRLPDVSIMSSRESPQLLGARILVWEYAQGSSVFGAEKYILALFWKFFSAPAAKGFDVFNALDLMENKTFLEKLKFGIGDGNLQYYLYNWRCPGMESEKVGLVLQ